MNDLRQDGVSLKALEQLQKFFLENIDGSSIAQRIL